MLVFACKTFSVQRADHKGTNLLHVVSSLCFTTTDCFFRGRAIVLIAPSTLSRR